jgi:hypothetical protein
VACGANPADHDDSGAQRPDISGMFDAEISTDAAVEDGGPLADAVDTAPDSRPVFDSSVDQYAQQCATCHGSTGEGGQGPALAGWLRPRSTLVNAIDRRMPQVDPRLCTGECAEEMANYILSWTNLDCEEPRPGPRAMRLLTRREFDNTVQDLVTPRVAVCASDRGCENLRE